MVCLILELVGPWVELGFSVGMETFLSSYCLMFPEFKSSLMFSGFGFNLLLLVFSFIFTVASRLLHLYSTDDKTSRWLMKVSPQ